MVRKSVPTGRRRLGSLLGAGGLGVLVAVTAAACASTATTGAAGSSSVPVVASTSAAAPSASASPSSAGSTAAGGTASASNHPLIPSTGGLVNSPQAQLTTIPAGDKLVAFDSAVRSKDGMTLYLGLESQGGACGRYDVVLQQDGATLHVGLVHLPRTSGVCPMYVAHMLVPAKLSAPLSGSSVVDLANGQVVQAPEAS